jgi:hypothetical protein
MSNVYLDENNVDDLGRMIVGLLSELWIVRDRLAVVEELLVSNGVLAAEAVDGFAWSQAKAEEMEALRDRIVAAVIGAPIAAKERSVDQILERAGYQQPARVPA